MKTKILYEDGPLNMHFYRNNGIRTKTISLSDTIDGEASMESRVGVGGNPVWFVIESESEFTVKQIELAGKQLEKVLNR